MSETKLDSSCMFGTLQQKNNIKGLDALYLAEKQYYLQKLNNPLIISSILYMKGVAKYSLSYNDYCKDFNSSLKYKTYLVKEQIDFIRKACGNQNRNYSISINKIMLKILNKKIQNYISSK